MNPLLQRILLVVSAILFAAPLAVEAQQASKIHRVGVLVPTGWEPEAFRQTLRQLGYIEGSNLVLDIRMAEGKLDRLPGIALELVKSTPDVIVAINTPGTKAAIAATRIIPIVMVSVGDPIATGFVSSLAHPGGNVTGVSNFCGELGAKRLALLKEAVPSASRIAVMLNPDDPITTMQVNDIERAAPSIGVQVRFFPARTTEQLGSTFESLLKWRPSAVLWLCGQGTGLEERTISLASKHKLPVMPYTVGAVQTGGLASYATNIPDVFRRAATYVDRILKGAKPADLPVEQPTTFELVINLKTAKALGLKIPQSLLVRADRVIE
jgi:putative ABC transport system substrate-binding protein